MREVTLEEYVSVTGGLPVPFGEHGFGKSFGLARMEHTLDTGMVWVPDGWSEDPGPYHSRKLHAYVVGPGDSPMSVTVTMSDGSVVSRSLCDPVGPDQEMGTRE